jgi:hypothetical protein
MSLSENSTGMAMTKGLASRWKKGYTPWNKGRREHRSEVLQKMRVSCSPWNKGLAYTTAFQNKVAPLYQSGKSLREIADTLGSNRMTVQRALKLAGCERRSAELSQHQLYHVNRRVVSLVCELCQAEEVEVDDFAEAWEATQIRHKTIDVDGCNCAGCRKLRLIQ